MFRVVELFGGIGAFTNALKRLDVDFKVVDYIELDKNSVKSYNKLYDENFSPQDIRDFSLKDKQIDILMHGSPCQDFSRIGLKKGGVKDSNTRSSLLFETVRIIEEAKYKPTWVIWENVRGVLDKNMRNSFFYYLEEMKMLGYETKYEILNAMDFSIPQSRSRLFAISYFGSNAFDFNNLEKSPMRDVDEFLENEVDEKYIVNQGSILRHIEYMNLVDKKIKDPPKFKGRCKVIKDFVYTISTKQMRIPNSGLIELDNGKYRYLTERECFRLMGFTDDDFNKLREIYKEKENKTSSILYRQAGNSIVVDVLVSILKEILSLEKNKKEKNMEEDEMKRLTSFSALECDEIKEKVHHRQIDEIFNKLAKLGNMKCTVEVSYEDEANKDKDLYVLEDELENIEDILGDIDNKSGVDIFVDKNSDLVFKVYGSFYTKDDKHYMNVTKVKVEGLEQGKKVHLGDIFEEKTANNKKDREIDR